MELLDPETVNPRVLRSLAMIPKLAVVQESFQYQAMENSTTYPLFVCYALPCYANSLLITLHISRIFCISTVYFLFKPPAGIHVVLGLAASPVS